MPNEYLAPPDLHDSARYGYSQVVASTGGKTIRCAGIVGWDKDRKIAGADMAAQMDQALSNIRHALQTAGADMDDVARLEIYIVDYRPEMLEDIGRLLRQHFAADKLPANTVLGVQALALPELKVEITATAVVG